MGKSLGTSQGTGLGVVSSPGATSDYSVTGDTNQLVGIATTPPCPLTWWGTLGCRVRCGPIHRRAHLRSQVLRKGGWVWGHEPGLRFPSDHPPLPACPVLGPWPPAAGIGYSASCPGRSKAWQGLAPGVPRPGSRLPPFSLYLRPLLSSPGQLSCEEPRLEDPNGRAPQ